MSKRHPAHAPDGGHAAYIRRHRLARGDSFSDPETGQPLRVVEDVSTGALVSEPYAPVPYDPWKEIGGDLSGGRDPVETIPTDLPRRPDGTIAPFYDLTQKELAALDQDVPQQRKVRHDGWTEQRRRDFLERLAGSASVSDAARYVGMSRQSARDLYNRDPAFRAGWDGALRSAVSVLAETAFDRAVNGTQEQVFYKGRMVGFREKYNDRLLMFLLRVRDPLNFAPLDDLQGWQRFRALEAKKSEAPALPDRRPEGSALPAPDEDSETPHT